MLNSPQIFLIDIDFSKFVYLRRPLTILCKLWITYYIKMSIWRTDKCILVNHSDGISLKNVWVNLTFRFPYGAYFS